MSRDLGHSSGNPKWFEYSHKIEAFIKADKKLNANVDFYSASTYHTLGIAVDLFTPIFAVSRVAGWTAHVIEQLDDNRLIRPEPITSARPTRRNTQRSRGAEEPLIKSRFPPCTPCTPWFRLLLTLNQSFPKRKRVRSNQP